MPRSLTIEEIDRRNKIKDDFFDSIRNRDAEEARDLFESHKFLRGVDHYGTTVVHQIISMGDSRGLEILKYCGADLELKNKHGVSPIEHAVLKENENALKFLVRNGVDINKKYGEDKETVLHLAASKGSEEMLRSILSIAAVDINAENKRGESAIYYTERGSRAEALLLERGVAPRAISEDPIAPDISPAPTPDAPAAAISSTASAGISAEEDPRPVPPRGFTEGRNFDAEAFRKIFEQSVRKSAPPVIPGAAHTRHRGGGHDRGGI